MENEKPQIVDIVLVWLYTHDAEAFGKPGIKAEDETHKNFRVDDFFAVIELAHRLEIADLLAHAYCLIRERFPLVLEWAVYPKNSEWTGTCSDECKLEISYYLKQAPSLPRAVKVECENSIVSGLTSCNCDWKDIFNEASIGAYMEANQNFARKLIFGLDNGMNRFNTDG